MREIGTEDDVKLTLIIELSAELHEVCVNRRRTIHVERPHRRQKILIAKPSRFIRVQMGKRTECNDPIGSQQQAEHNCRIPSHRLTDRDQPARLYGVNQGAQGNDDRVHITTQTENTSVVPTIEHISQKDSIKLHIEASLASWFGRRNRNSVRTSLLEMRS